MRAAAALALLLATVACSSDDLDVSSTAEESVLPRSGDLPAEAWILVVDGEDVVDLAHFRGMHEPPHSAVSLPPSCGSLTPSAVQRFADENLGCGTCYAILCEGSLYAHMCTHQCDATIDPDADDTVPVTMK